MNGSRTMIMRGSEQPHFAADSHFAAVFIIFYRTVFIRMVSIRDIRNECRYEYA